MTNAARSSVCTNESTQTHLMHPAIWLIVLTKRGRDRDFAARIGGVQLTVECVLHAGLADNERKGLYTLDQQLVLPCLAEQHRRLFNDIIRVFLLYLY